MIIPKELVASSAMPIILSILNHGENYGYAIIQDVRRLSGDVIQWTDGMLYPVLHRLENQKLIHSRWGKSKIGRKRKYYRLTKKGIRALAKSREQWITIHSTLEKLWGGQPCLT